MDPVPDPPDAIEPEFANDVRGLAKAELEPGERLLWAGRPAPKAEALAGTTVFGWITAGVMTLVALAAFATAIWHPRAGEAVVWLVLLGLAAALVAFFTCAGLANGVSQRRNERAKREGTLFALTDRRAIIWVPEAATGAVAVHTVPRGHVARVHRLEYPDGSGDVVLTFSANGYDWQFPSKFEGVADVRRVEEQVRRTLIVPGEPKADRTV